MAKLTTTELIDAFKELSLIELSECVKAFEETFDVTAAAPVAFAGAAAPAAAAEEAFGAARLSTTMRALLTGTGIFLVSASVVGVLWYGAQDVLAG